MPFDGTTFRPDPRPARLTRSVADILRGWAPARPRRDRRRTAFAHWIRRFIS